MQKQSVSKLLGRQYLNKHCRPWYHDVWGISLFFAPSFHSLTPGPELLYFISLRVQPTFQKVFPPLGASAWYTAVNRSVIYRWRMPLRSFIHSQLKWVKNRTFRIWDKVTLRLRFLKQCFIHLLSISTSYIPPIHAKNVWCCGEGYFGQKKLRKKCVNCDKM